jgi:hypothetical protein
MGDIGSISGKTEFRQEGQTHLETLFVACHQEEVLCHAQ